MYQTVIMVLLGIAVPLSVGPPPQASAADAQANLLQQAQAAEKAGKLQESLAVFEQILQSSPPDAQAQAGETSDSEKLALRARAAGNDSAALSYLLNAAKYAPQDPRLLYDTGVLEDRMRLYWDADATVTRLQALPGGSQPAVLYLAARIKMDLGQLAAAVERMRAYLKARPEDASAHYGLGRMLQLQENFAEAKAQFQQSLTLAPHQTESQFQLGEIALAQDNYPQAIADYAQTLAANPKHAGALAGTGIAWFHLRQYARAETGLRQAIAADPDYQPAHYYLGLTLGRLGRKEEAREQLEQAAAMAQQQAQADAQRMHIKRGAAAPTLPGSGGPP
jgi:tetratricopeptide (TPR) repeat protein